MYIADREGRTEIGYALRPESNHAARELRISKIDLSSTEVRKENHSVCGKLCTAKVNHATREDATCKVYPCPQECRIGEIDSSGVKSGVREVDGSGRKLSSRKVAAVELNASESKFNPFHDHDVGASCRRCAYETNCRVSHFSVRYERIPLNQRNLSAGIRLIRHAKEATQKIYAVLSVLLPIVSQSGSAWTPATRTVAWSSPSCAAMAV